MNKLLEREIISIKLLSLAPRYRFITINSMINRKKIICIADAPGPAESLAPVIPLLKEDAEVITIAVGTAVKILQPLGAIACDDEFAVDGLFNNLKPDILLSAISSLTHGPYVNNKFVKIAHKHAIPVISLQDYWGNHRSSQNKEIISRINAVCVVDEFAASLWKEDGFGGEIFVTGNPAFDRFAMFNVAEQKNNLRARLHIHDSDRVILYAGQGTPHHIEADKKTFSYVTDAIRALNEHMPVKLIVRPHPRAVETQYYEEHSHDIETIDTSSFEFTDEILSAVDVVVSMFSTNLLHACFLRIPAISVLLPEQGKALLKEIGLDDFPPNVMGATAGVYDENPDSLKIVLKKIFIDKPFCASLHKRQEKNFSLNRDAAGQVAAEIKKII